MLLGPKLPLPGGPNPVAGGPKADGGLEPNGGVVPAPGGPKSDGGLEPRPDGDGGARLVGGLAAGTLELEPPPAVVLQAAMKLVFMSDI